MSCIKFDSTQYTFDSDQITFDNVCVKDIESLLDGQGELISNISTLRDLALALNGKGNLQGAVYSVYSISSSLQGDGTLFASTEVVVFGPETIIRDSLSDKWFEHIFVANSLIVKEVLFDKNTVTLTKYFDSIIK